MQGIKDVYNFADRLCSHNSRQPFTPHYTIHSFQMMIVCKALLNKSHTDKCIKEGTIRFKHFTSPFHTWFNRK